MNIDNYFGVYNDIKYSWENNGSYAVLSMIYHNQEYKRNVGNISKKDLDDDLIRSISEMEIDLILSSISLNNYALNFMENQNG